MSEHIRPLRKSDLEAVLEWRNHPDVRQYMYTTHEITWQEHLSWFNSNQKSGRHHLLIYETNETPRGFIKFTPKTCGNVCDWGFYLSPDAERGTGQALGRAALNYGFDKLGLHKVCGEALGFNERSRRFHTKLGFIEEGYHVEQHFDGNKYHDVVSFGLLRKSWEMREVNDETGI